MDPGRSVAAFRIPAGSQFDQILYWIWSFFCIYTEAMYIFNIWILDGSPRDGRPLPFESQRDHNLTKFFTGFGLFYLQQYAFNVCILGIKWIKSKTCGVNRFNQV